MTQSELGRVADRFIDAWQSRTSSTLTWETLSITSLPGSGSEERRFRVVHRDDRRLPAEEQRFATVIVVVKQDGAEFVLSCMRESLTLPTDPGTVRRAQERLTKRLLEKVEAFDPPSSREVAMVNANIETK